MNDLQVIATAMLATFGDAAEQQAIALARAGVLQKDKVAAKVWGDIFQLIGRLQEQAPNSKIPSA
jgi:hypothetical protein